MRPVVRSVLAVLAGALAAALVIGGAEAVSRLLYPPERGSPPASQAAPASGTASRSARC
jgi:hypothetical protein